MTITIDGKSMEALEVSHSESKNLRSFLKEIKDPRIDRNKQHKLTDIIIIAICGIIAGADGFQDIEFWAKHQEDWLKKYLELENGIPSHDTIERVFHRLNPKQFNQAFLDWIAFLSFSLENKVVAIDGKTLRRSHNKSKNIKPLHLVTAWVKDYNITLGQIRTDEKSNEITAIPALLETLAIKGCIVTIDAMGCQKSIAGQIVDKNADYTLALKENHKDLYDDVKYYFEEEEKVNFKSIEHQQVVEKEKDHGRIETRKVDVVSADWLPEEVKSDWKGLKSVARVTSIRTEKSITTTSVRFYITSLMVDAAKLAQVIRDHWSIESFNWTLDVTFNEDNSRIRKDYAPENFALVKRLSASILKKDTSNKYSIRNRRKLAMMNPSYIEKLLKANTL